MIFERIESCHMMKFRIRRHYTHWTGNGSRNPLDCFYWERKILTDHAFHLTQVSGKGQENWGSHGDPCSVPASSRRGCSGNVRQFVP
jgi:hypothetical protein